MICEYFAKTKITLPIGHTIEAECKVCPLKEESTEDCLKDIDDKEGEYLGKVSNEILYINNEKRNKIWRKFYAKNP